MKKHKFIEANRTGNKHNDNEAKRRFASRIQDIHEALADANQRDALLNDCLAIDAKIVLRVALSTGGPEDGFQITCAAATGQPLQGCYFFANWSFRREWPLSAEELDAVCAAYAIGDARLYLTRP